MVFRVQVPGIRFIEGIHPDVVAEEHGVGTRRQRSHRFLDHGRAPLRGYRRIQREHRHPVFLETGAHVVAMDMALHHFLYLLVIEHGIHGAEAVRGPVDARAHDRYGWGNIDHVLVIADVVDGAFRTRLLAGDSGGDGVGVLSDDGAARVYQFLRRMHLQAIATPRARVFHLHTRLWAF